MITREEALDIYFEVASRGYTEIDRVINVINVIFDSMEEENNMEENIEQLTESIDEFTFDNSHLVAQYMYKNLDIKIVEALMLELEAQIRFGSK
jgi:hypothetical protein